MEKKSNKGLIVALIAVLLVLAVGATVYALTMTDTADEEGSDQTAQQMNMTDEEHANMDKTTNTAATTSESLITFTDKGFDKANYTFSEGAVTVKNESSMDMQFSSDDHPTHRDHSELNMKVLGRGESGTFTPPGKGTYEFHDHINDQFKGAVRIE